MERDIKSQLPFILNTKNSICSEKKVKIRKEMHLCVHNKLPSYGKYMDCLPSIVSLSLILLEKNISKLFLALKNAQSKYL